jgi:uncharacterized surface protein with fasciclin (FAS1) repeats
MKKARHANRLSVVAIAVGLACGGTAIAGDKSDKDKAYDPSATSNEYQHDQASMPEKGSDYGQARYDMDEQVAKDELSKDEYSDTKHDKLKQDQYSRADQVSTSEQPSMAADMPANDKPKKTLIADDVKSNKNLTKFADAVEKAGLADALSDGTQYTVFAPTDEAFEKFAEQNGEISNEQLREILRNHIVAGQVKAAQAKTLDSAKVLTGEEVKITSSGETLEVGDAKVVEADIGSDNLTIHTIDTVLAANTSQDWGEAEESE